MPLTMTARDGRLYVQGEMTIYCAAILKEQLFDAMRAHAGAIVVDLSGVSEIDTAGVQVLLLVRRVALASGAELLLVAASDAVREILGLTGLAHWLTTVEHVA